MSSSAITGPVLSDTRRAPSGTAAAPSFAFNDSTGTGVYLVSPGVLGLSTNGAQRVVVDASGNVGIGTASPGATLHINRGTTGAEVLRLQGGTGAFNDPYLSFYKSDGSARNGYIQVSPTDFGIGLNGSGTITFASNSAERMRLDASGRLCVGVTEAGPSTGVGVISARGYAARSGTNGTFANVFNIMWTGSAQLWIDQTNVGTIAFTSDYRVKKNVETQEQPALERIAQLRPVKYEFANYGTLFKEDGVQREGFIAHELQEVIPSAVEGEKDAEEQIQSLKLDALCSVMVKAIQELEARLAALESK
jgi:hypothetical protein